MLDGGESDDRKEECTGGLIWELQAVVTGSGMSGGERGSRLGCNAQTHTCIGERARMHTHVDVHEHIAFPV